MLLTVWCQRPGVVANKQCVRTVDMIPPDKRDYRQLAPTFPEAAFHSDGLNCALLRVSRSKCIRDETDRPNHEVKYGKIPGETENDSERPKNDRLSKRCCFVYVVCRPNSNQYARKVNHEPIPSALKSSWMNYQKDEHPGSCQPQSCQACPQPIERSVSRGVHRQ